MSRTNDTHTPVPWLAPEDGPGAIVTGREAGMNLLGFVVDGVAIFSNKVDAPFVVRCVNAHEDLVAALEAVMAIWLRDAADGDGIREEDGPTLEVVRAALKKARGET